MRRALAAVTSCLAATVWMSSGCAAPAQDITSVSKDALRDRISKELSTAGHTPQSVTCPADLVGEVGRTAACDVAFDAADDIRVNARVTAVDGTSVEYDTTPSMTQAQLNDSLAAVVRRSTSARVDGVSCESGLAGTVGATAYCNVTLGPMTYRQMVAVNHVDGLLMTFAVVPHMAKADVESSVQARLQQQLGQRPYGATCQSDLQGVVGATVTCDVFVGAGPRTFLLTVTSVDGVKIDYRLAPAD